MYLVNDDNNCRVSERLMRQFLWMPNGGSLIFASRA